MEKKIGELALQEIEKGRGRKYHCFLLWRLIGGVIGQKQTVRVMKQCTRGPFIVSIPEKYKTPYLAGKAGK